MPKESIRHRRSHQHRSLTLGSFPVGCARIAPRVCTLCIAIPFLKSYLIDISIAPDAIA